MREETVIGMPACPGFHGHHGPSQGPKRREVMELKGSVAIVTGCTGGLGQRIGRAFAENGTQVAGVYVQSKEQAESFAREWS